MRVNAYQKNKKNVYDILYIWDVYSLIKVNAMRQELWDSNFNDMLKLLFFLNIKNLNISGLSST